MTHSSPSTRSTTLDKPRPGSRVTPELRAALGRRSREFALRNWDWDSTVERYLDLFRTARREKDMSAAESRGRGAGLQRSQLHREGRRRLSRRAAGARIVVVDNRSTDGTGEIAHGAGAEVVRESRQGKGFALLAGLRYARSGRHLPHGRWRRHLPGRERPLLIAGIQAGADMVIGTRLQGAGAGAFPIGHSWGNRAFIAVVRLLFGIRTLDLFSGYRALTRRLLEQSPLIAQGFEIETELSIQAFVNRFRVEEVPVVYRARTGDSQSKLHTISDGYRIAIAILAFFRDYRPLTAFGLTALLLFLASISAGKPRHPAVSRHRASAADPAGHLRCRPVHPQRAEPDRGGAALLDQPTRRRDPLAAGVDDMDDIAPDGRSHGDGAGHDDVDAGIVLADRRRRDGVFESPCGGSSS